MFRKRLSGICTSLFLFNLLQKKKGLVQQTGNERLMCAQLERLHKNSCDEQTRSGHSKCSCNCPVHRWVTKPKSSDNGVERRKAVNTGWQGRDEKREVESFQCLGAESTMRTLFGLKGPTVCSYQTGIPIVVDLKLF